VPRPRGPRVASHNPAGFEGSLPDGDVASNRMEAIAGAISAAFPRASWHDGCRGFQREAHALLAHRLFARVALRGTY
jgi:hypothetical protein